MVKNANHTARLQWKVDTIKSCKYLQCTLELVPKLLESVNFQGCFLVVKCSKMDGFWIFKRTDKPIYIFSYAGSMKNVNLRLFEPTVKLRSGQKHEKNWGTGPVMALSMALTKFWNMRKNCRYKDGKKIEKIIAQNLLWYLPSICLLYDFSLTCIPEAHWATIANT